MSPRTKRQTRKFADHEAKRERVPLFVGLVGPTGCGKTYSALRLATGMQRVYGGKIFGIDTEARRMLHYAKGPDNPNGFEFRHVVFEAPFGPLDYLDSIEHCVRQQASIVIIDSLSHEHEGPGGVLEMHDDYMESKNWEERFSFTAWIEPKKQRNRLINTIKQLGVTVIFCYRAKPKMKIVKGKDPMDRGWQPIAGDEYGYEMMVGCLLLPGADGVPTWNPEKKPEESIVKCPRQFRALFAEPHALCEDDGEAMARWAAGNIPAPSEDEFHDVVHEITGAKTIPALADIGRKHSGKPWEPAQRLAIRGAYEARQTKLKEKK